MKRHGMYVVRASRARARVSRQRRTGQPRQFSPPFPRVRLRITVCFKQVASGVYLCPLLVSRCLTAGSPQQAELSGGRGPLGMNGELYE